MCNSNSFQDGYMLFTVRLMQYFHNISTNADLSIFVSKLLYSLISWQIMENNISTSHWS